MRSQHRAEQIVRRAHVRDPVAHRFVDRVLQRARAGIHAHHFRAQQAHAEDVEPLALHVLGAHVDDAFEAQARRHRRRGDSVLARAGFRDDAALAHAHGQQALADAIVDFVRAGVQQVFALDVNARAAQMLRQPRSKLQRRGPPGKILAAGSRALSGNSDPCARPRTRARVPRAAPPASPERSGRRTGRSGPSRPARFVLRWSMSPSQFEFRLCSAHLQVGICARRCPPEGGRYTNETRSTALNGGEQRAQSRGILAPGPRFDAAGHIHGVRLGDANGLGDIFRRQAARQNDASIAARALAPISNPACGPCRRANRARIHPAVLHRQRRIAPAKRRGIRASPEPP